MKFYTLFTQPPKPASPHGGVSMTDKASLKDCDINTIIKRYNAGDTSVARGSAYFGDVSNVGDFQSALEKVNTAKAEFEKIPAEVRAKFGNDPLALVQWLADSSHDDEAVSLGLKVKKVEEKPLEQKIVDGVTSALKDQAEAKTAQSV